MFISSTRRFVLAAVTATLLLAPGVSARACTGLFTKAADGAVVYARSLEFATPLKSELLIFPRGHQSKPQLPGGVEGPAFTAKYGFVGMNAMGLPHVVDGLNEKGLQVGLFWFPGFSQYAKFDPKKADSTITPWDFGEFILGQCATVKEAREKLANIDLVAEFSKELGSIPTAHFWMVDASGDSLVAEPVGGKLVLHDNPVGVFTNSPTFDWHLINLGNYVNLSPDQAKATKIGDLEINPLGNGAGLLGLPGDITPPSRFVRAAFYRNALPQYKNGPEALYALMRLHQAFFIAEGMAKPGAGDSGPLEITEWEIYTDLTNKKLYYATYGNLAPRFVDVAKLDFSPGPIRTLSIEQPVKFEDMTSSFK